MSNETRAKCTDLLPAKGGLGPSNPLYPDMQHQPGVLYYGYITPFVNMTVGGWVWCKTPPLDPTHRCSRPQHRRTVQIPLPRQGRSSPTLPTPTPTSPRRHRICRPRREQLRRGDGQQQVRIWIRLRALGDGAGVASTPDTTDPLAPFGIATLAAGGSEGNGEHMAGMRWSETGNFGTWDNPALPNTFGSQQYDLADPWAASGAGDGNGLNAFGNATKCCKTWNSTKHAANADCLARGQHGSCGDPYQCALLDPLTGKYGANCSVWNVSLWSSTLQPIAPLVRLKSPSGIPGHNFMGGIHPRLKRPVGRRLAIAAVNLLPKYRSYAVSTLLKGQTAVTGPTLAGCRLGGSALSAVSAAGVGITASGSSGQQLALKFNKTLLGTEGLMVRPFDADMSEWQWRFDSSHQVLNKSDSSGLMVCTINGTVPDDPMKPRTGPVGNATTCRCQSWLTFSDNRTTGRDILYCEVGPGWKPDVQNK